MKNAIFFFHLGKFPSYLCNAIESARYFNRNAPIFLITDQRTANLKPLQIECIKVDSLASERHTEFLKRYLHVSSSDLIYERRCVERWFHFEVLMAKYGVQNAVVLDSDAVLFCDIQEIFELVPTQFQFACSKAGGPALTVIRRSIEPLLDHILARYASSEYLDEACERHKAAKSAGRMDNLTDMTFCEEFTREHPLGYVYLNQTEVGHLDHGIYLPDGMKSRKIGRRQRKRVVWNADGPTLLPYFLKEADGSLVRALVIHFQSKGKRMISNFNPVRESIWSSRLGLSIRSFLFNFRMN